MVRQPIPELIRLYKEDSSKFTVSSKILDTKEIVDFYIFNIKHKQSGVTINLQENIKTFPFGDIYDPYCDTSYLITGNKFKLSNLEKVLIENAFKYEYNKYLRSECCKDKDEIARMEVNKLLSVNNVLEPTINLTKENKWDMLTKIANLFKGE